MGFRVRMTPSENSGFALFLGECLKHVFQTFQAPASSAVKQGWSSLHQEIIEKSHDLCKCWHVGYVQQMIGIVILSVVLYFIFLLI